LIASSLGASISRVGVYDEYEPVPSPRCPWCGAGFGRRWYGKDGPNAFFLWRQGQPHPIGQPIDEDARMDPERYVEFLLPEEFSVTGECDQGHMADATGRCKDGVWREFTLNRTTPDQAST
jgi:hypothetical protein